MHTSVARQIKKFYIDYQYFIDNNLVADLGSLNINGAAKDIIKHAVGFDIVNGPGVDVVIEPGKIPDEYLASFGLVLSVNSFVFCPDPFLYRAQIIDLLRPRGYMFLTMCSEKCKEKHTTSSNVYGFGDEFRMERIQAYSFFSDKFSILEFTETNYEHSDYIILGQLKE